MKKNVLLTFFNLLVIVAIGYSQNPAKIHSYTRYDTLRGSITKERAWWDLKHYELSIAIDTKNQSIKGQNIIQYTPLESYNILQIDLQYPLVITKIMQDGEVLKFERDSAAHFVYLMKPQSIGDLNEITVEFSGHPHKAIRAPWDGGFTWSKDSNGNDFIATSCQGIGASIWWPNKDHMYDEPDLGIVIHANVPKDLVAVANGRLEKVKNEKDKTKTYTWRVVNPINNYGVNINIGDYVNFSEIYDGEKGKLDMDYWVLKQNLAKAKLQFRDANRQMEAFEHWFGPYPFYEDSYKLVEVPYTGMEHQSSVTYGNGYKNGYNGKDNSETGWGLKFDFIIIHESGHEWFANNITYRDMADMWIHESFTNYSEALFVEYFYGKEAGSEYVRGQRIKIKNQSPIIGDYDVNNKGSGDMYPKGGNMLHTLRQIVNDDDKWRLILRGLNAEFYHQTVTTNQIESYIANEAGINLSYFFDQYLRDYRIPVFEYRILENTLVYRWTNCIEGFNMPLKVTIDGVDTVLKFSHPISNKFELSRKNAVVKIDPNYYVYGVNVMGN